MEQVDEETVHILCNVSSVQGLQFENIDDTFYRLGQDFAIVVLLHTLPQQLRIIARLAFPQPTAKVIVDHIPIDTQHVDFILVLHWKVLHKELQLLQQAHFLTESQDGLIIGASDIAQGHQASIPDVLLIGVSHFVGREYLIAYQNAFFCQLVELDGGFEVYQCYAFDQQQQTTVIQADIIV